LYLIVLAIKKKIVMISFTSCAEPKYNFFISWNGWRNEHRNSRTPPCQM